MYVIILTIKIKYQAEMKWDSWNVSSATTHATRRHLFLDSIDILLDSGLAKCRLQRYDLLKTSKAVFEGFVSPRNSP